MSKCQIVAAQYMKYGLYYLFHKNMFEKLNINRNVAGKLKTAGKFRGIQSVYQIIFPISEPKHMLWVLKRTVSMRRFF